MNAVPAGRALLSGSAALVTLMRRQRALDRAAGLETSGFVSGYRGSPLGGVDFAMWQAARALEADDIRFVPGLNEELAATAIWGTQQLHRFGPARRAGVFALWYGKNPGLDRIGDVLKHANMEGSAAHGGVLVATGDDPAASSSTISNQGEQAFAAAMSPVLVPADVADIVDLGLAGFALSRYCGLWVGFKLVADVVESTRSFDANAATMPFVLPRDFELPQGGLNGRVSDDRWAQDERTLRFRLPAARAFARANRLDRTEVAPLAGKRVAFVAAGKAWRDLREALVLLGLADDELARAGIGLRRLALVWPIEEDDNALFLRGFEHVVVVEEKRAVIEPQLTALAYHWPSGQRPSLSGKRDASGRPLLPEHGEIGPTLVARVVIECLSQAQALPAERLATLAARLAPAASAAPVGGEAQVRKPHFCAGCPHSRSTRLPPGSLAMAGIGCHSMAMWMPGSRTTTLTQMGGEGANWIGAAPYVDVPHMFQNLGDGTYVHSGSLAIRAAVAAGVPITYKILVNEAVAMTGGQPVEGAPDAARIAWQLHAEGVSRIAVLTGRAAAFSGGARRLPPGAWLADRDDLDEVMRSLREFRGVSAIVYDQICATEKRRLRRRGTRFVDEPAVLINERICDDCGDCSVQSHCSAVRQVGTPFGPRRRIDSSTCNTDLSCVDGYCPSFITIENAQLRARSAPPRLSAPPPERLAALPEPRRAALPLSRPFGIVLAGVGGSGLVTTAALLAAAALREGLTVSQLDNTGLARKGGEVTTHLRLSAGAPIEGSTRIPESGADLLIGADLASAAAPRVLALLAAGARAVLTTDVTPMLEQVLDPDLPMPTRAWHASVRARLGADAITGVDGTAIATRRLGDTLYASVVVLGAAVQSGFVPVSPAAVEQAIREHGVAVEHNLAAFAWGRLAAIGPEAEEADETFDAPSAVGGRKSPAAAGHGRAWDDWQAAASFFADELVRYQDRSLSERYLALVRRVAEAEQRAGGTAGSLALAAACNVYDVLAVKDEYEVARLATDAAFLASLRSEYGPGARPHFHFAPAWLAPRATADGRRRKLRFGPWIIVVLRVLALLRPLRGTLFDPFAHQAERVAQRRFTTLYCDGLARVADTLDAGGVVAALEFARLPEQVRGYGPVRMPRLQAALRAAEESLRRLDAQGVGAQEEGTR